jgi:ankyrin repeat protein
VPLPACFGSSRSYVDVRTQTGFTAVHFAVQSNNQEALAMLLNMEANPLLSTLFDSLDTINCPKGTTALHLAARQGNEAIAKLLLRAYVSPLPLRTAALPVCRCAGSHVQQLSAGDSPQSLLACMCSKSLAGVCSCSW